MKAALDPSVRRVDGGTVLIGGSPLRILRLTEAGARVVDRLASTDQDNRLVRRLLDTGMAHPRPGPWTARVDVVIPVRDGTPPSIGDAIVVDDGSATPIAGATIRHDSPRGPAAARNAGWRRATADLVCFLDADCEPGPGWLDVLVPHFADPAVAAVAPRIISTGGGWLAAYDATRSPLDRGPHEGRVAPRSRIPFVPGTALIVRRAVLDELGGFDERLRFGEDVDLVWRMVEHGWTVRYEPATFVRHPARPTLTRWLRQRFDYGSSAAPLAARHPGAVAPVAVSGWSAASWALAALGWPGAGTAVAAMTTALLAPRLHGLEHPEREAVRLAGAGHAHAGAQIADAVRRAWWPAAVAAAVVSKRARRAAALAVLPALGDPLRLLDDLAYGAGVWAGCVAERRFAALAPDFTNWPGRRQAIERAASTTS